jgi:hypothetical protein
MSGVGREIARWGRVAADAASGARARRQAARDESEERGMLAGEAGMLFLLPIVLERNYFRL